jgi:hypothetical protein
MEEWRIAIAVIGYLLIGLGWVMITIAMVR